MQTKVSKEGGKQSQKATAQPQRLPAAAHAAIQRLQATAGNAAIAELLSQGRQPMVVQRQAEPPPAVTPADRERQLYAATTMRSVPALDAGARGRLDKAVSFAPIYKMIEDRNAKRDELKARQGDLDRANNELSIATNSVTDVSGAPGGAGPGAGEPEKADQRLQNARAEVARLSRLVEALGHDLNDRDAVVKRELAVMGVKDENELVTFVNETFPKTFIERGKQIANAQLDANQHAAEKERERYNTQQGGGNDRQGLRNAARDIDTRTKAISALYSTKRELPEGGADPDDPAVRELASIEARARPMQDELETKTAGYKLQYPILFRVDAQRIAETSDKDLDGLLDGPVTVILDNIKTTRENIASESLKIWKLNAKGANIAQLTKDDLDITAGSTLDQVIDRKAADDKTTGQVVTEALTALSIVADTIALLTGPAGVAVAGGITAVAALTKVAEDYKTYRALEAAGGTAIDPDAAKLAQEEPDLEGLIFSLATAGIAAMAAGGAIRKVIEKYRAARTAADLATFKKTINASVDDPAVRAKLAAEFERVYEHGPWGKRQGIATIKRLLIQRWTEGGRYRLVKVFRLDPMKPIATEVGGYIGEERYIAGKTPEEIAQVLGFDKKLVEKGVQIYHLERVPTAAEFELKGYTQTPLGRPYRPGIDHKDYPPGLGSPQWELNAKINVAGPPLTLQPGVKYMGMP